MRRERAQQEFVPLDAPLAAGLILHCLAAPNPAGILPEALSSPLSTASPALPPASPSLPNSEFHRPSVRTTRPQ